ncbi:MULTISPECIES: hypothetical protein [unclassified Cupriavidus]|uniref:hypothetical protein n=1 Tax=unclassified Cupriavidus TaxID=2640874 RepID=UPI0028B543B9|nr:hypothetical protein [Cupriavidus sp. SZY C1]MDT6963149.1 hypothetical protein [Cupriavidus sp. SZY C1]
MKTSQKATRIWEMATFAFLTGFAAHGQTSSSLGVFAGTLSVCALVARASRRPRSLPANGGVALA